MKIIISLIAISALAFASCTTTKTESNGTTTTTTAIDNSAATQAAIAAATQIATAAANAAIQTYLTKATPHARLHLSASDPAIRAAEFSTEVKIGVAEPSLSRDQVHKIVNKAYASEMRKQTSSP